MHTTSLSRQWLIKTGLFALLLLVFGVWGLLDATWLYPKRGLADASYQLRNWMDAADKAGRLSASTFTLTDPAAAVADLKGKESDLFSASKGDGPAARTAAVDLAKLEYLKSLDKAWRLNPAPKPLGETTKPTLTLLSFDPAKGEGLKVVHAPTGPDKTTLATRALFEHLSEFWRTNKQPTPLSGLDMFFQWVFVVVGFGGGLWLVVTILRAAGIARKHTWDPDAQRLTLPDGFTATPADLGDIDKRLWHKYFVTLITTSGEKRKLDLLRYQPLEQWVLAMEKTRFPPERAAEAAAKSDETANTDPNPAPPPPGANT